MKTKEEVLAQSRAHKHEVYLANPEKAKERARAYRVTNPERVAATKHRGYLLHRDEKKAYDIVYRSTHKDGIAARLRSWKYGASAEHYPELYRRQEGRCRICGRKFDVLCVDHSHLTGVLRDLLCQRCNRAFGLFFEDPEILESALRYARAWEGK